MSKTMDRLSTLARSVMRSHKWKGPQLAEAMSCSNDTVYRLLNGQLTDFKLSLAEKLLGLAGAELDNFLAIAKEPEAQPDRECLKSAIIALQAVRRDSSAYHQLEPVLRRLIENTLRDAHGGGK